MAPDVGSFGDLYLVSGKEVYPVSRYHGSPQESYCITAPQGPVKETWVVKERMSSIDQGPSSHHVGSDQVHEGQP